MDIPKIVHRIWFDVGKGSKPPPKYDAYRKSVEDLNPKWTFIEWDREKADELIQTHYPDYYPVWSNYKSEIYRIDAIRYFIMHHYGGIYIDQDIQMYKPFDDLLMDYFLASMIFVFSGHSKTTISNYFMASKKGHPFWDYCIKGLAKSQRNNFFHRKQSYFGVFFVCGPFYLNNNLLRWSKKHNWKKTSLTKVPSKVFSDPSFDLQDKSKFGTYRAKQDDKIVLLYKEAFYNPSTKNTVSQHHSTLKNKNLKNATLKTYGHHDYVFSWNPGLGVSPDYAVIFAVVIIIIVIIVIIVASVLATKNYKKYKQKKSTVLKSDFYPPSKSSSSVDIQTLNGPSIS